jgi:chromate reductase, NAD(P)H dehydrogenase (quinone)
MPITSRILLISGSTRELSTNSALINTAARVAPEGIRAVVFTGLARLPHFNPDDDCDPLPAEVRELRAAIAEADAILFCTPEYAGTLPGSFKNLLDWTVGGTEIAGKPVAIVNAAADARRGSGATATLRTVLGYVQAETVEDACLHVPVARDRVGDGVLPDEPTRAAIRGALTTLALAGRRRTW